jgi:hypothetical protein
LTSFDMAVRVAGSEARSGQLRATPRATAHSAHARELP